MTDAMNRPKPKVALVMLSAGASKRMGRPKQLLPWKGTTLLQYCLNQALLTEASELVLVLGCSHEEISSRIEPGRASVVINHHWEEGMSGSILAALDHLESNSLGFDGVMFCLSDQPLLDSMIYNQLIYSFIENPEKIISSAYQKALGVPAVFPKSMLGSLRNLKEDKGAKSIIQSHQDMVMTLDASDRAIDLDTMEQYKELYKIHGS